jgi:hypothetical protein
MAGDYRCAPTRGINTIRRDKGITLTIDDDAAMRLERERRRRRVSLRAIVNDVLRAGLDALVRPRPTTQFRTTGFDLGPSLVGSLDNVEEVLSRADGSIRFQV